MFHHFKPKPFDKGKAEWSDRGKPEGSDYRKPTLQVLNDERESSDYDEPKTIQIFTLFHNNSFHHYLVHELGHAGHLYFLAGIAAFVEILLLAASKPVLKRSQKQFDFRPIIIFVHDLLPLEGDFSFLTICLPASKSISDEP